MARSNLWQYEAYARKGLFPPPPLIICQTCLEISTDEGESIVWPCQRYGRGRSIAKKIFGDFNSRRGKYRLVKSAEEEVLYFKENCGDSLGPKLQNISTNFPHTSFGRGG